MLSKSNASFMKIELNKAHMMPNLWNSYFFAFQNTWASVSLVLKLIIFEYASKMPK